MAYDILVGLVLLKKQSRLNDRVRDGDTADAGTQIVCDGTGAVPRPPLLVETLGVCHPGLCYGGAVAYWGSC